MSKTSTFAFRVNKDQLDLCNRAIEKAKELFNLDTKAQAGLKIMDQWLDLASAEDNEEVKIIRPQRVEPPTDLESLCALEFLQFIVDPKDEISKWFCLKNQRPDGKGKPILMADGKDRYSIQKLCQACEQGFLYHEQRSNLGKAKAAIQKFGESEIIATINACVHPDNNAVQINLGEGNFYCTKSAKRVTIRRTCKPSDCEYFRITAAPIAVKDTEGFKEMTKLLTNSGGD